MCFILYKIRSIDWIMTLNKHSRNDLKRVRTGFTFLKNIYRLSLLACIKFLFFPPLTLAQQFQIMLLVVAECIIHRDQHKADNGVGGYRYLVPCSTIYVSITMLFAPFCVNKILYHSMEFISSNWFLVSYTTKYFYFFPTILSFITNIANLFTLWYYDFFLIGVWKFKIFVSQS